MALDILPDLTSVVDMTAGQIHGLAVTNNALYKSLIDRLPEKAKDQALFLLNGLHRTPAEVRADSLSLSSWFHVDGGGRLRYGGPPGPTGDQRHNDAICETLSGPASSKPFQWALNSYYRASLAALVWLLTRKLPV